MRVAVFSAKRYDKLYLDRANADYGHELRFLDARLELDTTGLAAGCDAACVFVNDAVGADVLEALEALGCRVVALRCAGFNNVDVLAARRLGIPVVRVPAYSPHAVAEFTVGLMLSALRHIPRAWSRVRDGNFALDGLVGRNLFGRTVGVVGTGRIGGLVAKALRSGFGCSVLAHDQRVDGNLEASGVEYVELDDLMVRSDIVTLHCPLTPETRHIVNRQRLEAAKSGLVLVNTSRGKLVDTEALIDALKKRRLGAVALDVYEQEENLFFQDLSDEVITDDVFQRLLTFPNVVVTGHQAFLTEEALSEIAETTLRALRDFERGSTPEHLVPGVT
jgi:D-lactate dehydrogenase